MMHCRRSSRNLAFDRLNSATLRCNKIFSCLRYPPPSIQLQSQLNFPNQRECFGAKLNASSLVVLFFFGLPEKTVNLENRRDDEDEFSSRRFLERWNAQWVLFVQTFYNRTRRLYCRYSFDDKLKIFITLTYTHAYKELRHAIFGGFVCAQTTMRIEIRY